MARWSFAARMLAARFDPTCGRYPYCESRYFHRLGRKWLLIEARQCTYCGLIYRWPNDLPGSSRKFYECSYDGQQATNVPSPGEVAALVGQNFADSDYDKSARVAFLHQVGIDPGRLERLLDFGCAWGYSVHQYRAAGFNTVGFEIDQARAAFGRQHLSVDLRSDWRAFADDERYDVLLTDHSLEHLPRPGVALEQFSRLAGERARLVIFVPNCGGLAARRLGTKWGPFIGEAHPIAFTSRWFAQNLPRHGFAPVFYTSHGHPLIGDDYLTDQDEIALVATRVPSRAG